LITRKPTVHTVIRGSAGYPVGMRCNKSCIAQLKLSSNFIFAKIITKVKVKMCDASPNLPEETS